MAVSSKSSSFGQREFNMLDILGYVFLAWMALLSAAGLVIMTKVTWEIVREIFWENRDER